MRPKYGLMLVAALVCAGTAWAQASPADAVASAVANSGAFPAGTTVLSTTIDGASVVVDLNAEAAAGLTDSQSDAMVAAIMGALGEFEGLTDLEVTAGGLPLWKYLPPPPAEASEPPAPLPAPEPAPMAPMAMRSMAVMDAPTGTSELAGKVVNLHPSHGTYLVDDVTPAWWAISQRTLCGPNPATKPPGWDSLWQSVAQGSNYYYNTMLWRWPSYYEDFGPPDYSSGTPEFINFVKAYCASSGATVRVSRELDKNAGDFNPTAYGYPAAPWPTPLYRMAALYNLQAKGYPSWIWTAFARDYDADIRARPYMANYHMALDNTQGLAENDPALWNNYISLHLHTNASTYANQACARGTEIYWYTSTYPYLQAKAQALASAVLNGTIGGIRNEYDGFWAESMYKSGTVPTEWPTAYGTYRGYQHAGTSTYNWQNRGVKTGNYGEIREAKMPAVLMEMLFHDDWKFYPDHVFEQDQIFRATTAWGIYEGICAYWGITPKARLSATLVSADFPTWVKPNDAIAGSVTMQNNGQAWCWGHKFVTATKTYDAYTVWKLAATANDQLAAGSKILLDASAVTMPGDTATFAVNLTAPAAEGTYTSQWRMLKDDARGGAFGDVATAQIGVDGTAPDITITAPEAKFYASVVPAFDASDALSGVASVVGTIDGGVVNSGEAVSLADGEHTLVVTAVDNVGNTATKSVTFQVDGAAPVITIGSPAAVDYPYGIVSVAFEATDGGSGVATVTGDIDGTYVSDGDMLYLSVGSHTLTVAAVDNVGNTASKSVTFKVVNTPGKTTAGGWIELANKKGTCGMTCSYDEGSAAPTGNVTYQDHDLKMTVKSTEIVAMGIRNNKASIYGTCTIEGQAGHWFRMDLTDNGEPGKTDVFSLTLDTGYKVGGTLGGGNITIH
jgi:hypothetical protein